MLTGPNRDSSNRKNTIHKKLIGYTGWPDIFEWYLNLFSALVILAPPVLDLYYEVNQKFKEKTRVEIDIRWKEVVRLFK